MALKVVIAVQIFQMDNTEVMHIGHADTVVSTSPGDPPSEYILAKQVASRLLSETEAMVGERLDEYAQLVARLTLGA